VVRAANAVRPRLARAAQAVRPKLERAAAAAKPQLTRVRPTRIRWPKTVRTWQYTAGAATVGVTLAVAVATAAGPWDSTGQRTAEADRAADIRQAQGTA